MRVSKAVLLLISILIVVSLFACKITGGPAIPKEEIPQSIEPKVRMLIDGLYSRLANKRAESAKELGKMKKEAIPAVPFLIALLNDQSEVEDSGNKKKVTVTVGVIAARALGNIGDSRAVKPLMEATKGNIAMKYAGIRALGKIGKPSLESLIEAMSDEDELVRKYVSEALGVIGDEQAVDVLIEALTDEYDPVRGNAVVALDYIGDRRAVMPLISVLNNESISSIKSDAARALGKMNDTRAVDALIEALLDPDYEVKSSASIALNSITGKDYGHDNKRWMWWWEKNKNKFSGVSDEPVEEEEETYDDTSYDKPDDSVEEDN